eukprot:60985-Rhodomonas_salina.1
MLGAAAHACAVLRCPRAWHLVRGTEAARGAGREEAQEARKKAEEEQGVVGGLEERVKEAEERAQAEEAAKKRVESVLKEAVAREEEAQKRAGAASAE